MEDALCNGLQKSLLLYLISLRQLTLGRPSWHLQCAMSATGVFPDPAVHNGPISEKYRPDC